MFGLRRSLTVGAAIASVVPLLGIAASGYWLYDDIAVTAGRLDKTIAIAQQKDVPLSSADIAFDEISKGNDGAKFLAELHRKWSSLSDGDKRAVQLTIGSFLVDHPALPEGSEESLAFASEVSAIADRAAACSDYSRSNLGVDDEEMAEFRLSIVNVSRILCGRAAQLASQGKWSSAFGSLAIAQRLGDHLARHDGIDGLSAQVTIGEMALTRACQLVNDRMDSAECRAGFQNFLKGDRHRIDLMGAVERESMVANTVFGSSESFDGGFYSGVQLKLKDRTFQKASAVRMLEFWIETLSRVRSVAPDQLEMSDAYSGSIRSFLAQRSPSRVLVQSAVQRHESVVKGAVSLTVKQRLAQVLSALISSKSKTGHWPHGIDELGIDLQDPSSGGLLVYQKTNDGFIVYSAGSNRLDDEGSEEDIVLSVAGGNLTIFGN